MNAGLVWSLVALGLATVVVRRRSAGIVLVTVQSLALAIGAFALAGDRSTGYLISCVALLAKAAFVGVALGWSLNRTREQRPVRDGLPAPVRFVIAIAIGSGTAALVPSFGLPESAGNATVALVGIGAAIVLLRRATIFQALGLVVAENGVAIGAASARDGLPLVVELGFAFDVLVLIAVVLVVHERIFGEFGTGDTRLLRGLRDR